MWVILRFVHFLKYIYKSINTSIRQSRDARVQGHVTWYIFVLVIPFLPKRLYLISNFRWILIPDSVKSRVAGHVIPKAKTLIPDSKIVLMPDPIFPVKS